jgi:arsenite/tail-anchored protein-transporting ATPase
MLDELLTKRAVLITGKGGVGRSCVTAALATVAHRRGIRVLVAEIGDNPDDYSPLARHFGRDRLPPTAEEILPGVWSALLLARTGHELFLKSALHSGSLAKAALSSDALRRLLSAAPSFREMGVFFQLLSFLREQLPDGTPRFQLILLDMPATGHTLSLTGLPELLLRLLPSGPIATALREGQSYLNDPKLAAAYVIAIPEALPVSECLDLLQGLQQTRMPTGGVILNRIPQDPFTPAERAALAPMVERLDLFGKHEFGRPARSHRELERLRRGTNLPIRFIPELPSDGLIAALADALELATTGANPFGQVA